MSIFFGNGLELKKTNMNTLYIDYIESKDYALTVELRYSDGECCQVRTCIYQLDDKVWHWRGIDDEPSMPEELKNKWEKSRNMILTKMYYAGITRYTLT